MQFEKTFALHVPSATDASCMVCEGEVRVSVLTDRLIRVEVGAFTDAPTQKVWYRDFERPVFHRRREGSLLSIITDTCVFRFDLQKKEMRSITVDGKTVTEFEKENLKGTYRTLDGTVGPVPLGQGVVSRNGVACLDDRKSLLLGEDGTIRPRPAAKMDSYYFAYGTDYRGAVQALFRLTGPVPLVPRYSLGNWWSRYKAYTQQEYLELMNTFLKKEIPITVATIDMDWHWVDVVERFGPAAKPPKMPPWGNFGWTGYSWNTDLFPDYKSFLAELKRKNFKITMNIHPCDGVRFFEEQYADMARAMGIDPASKKPVAFDITDPEFVAAYFTYLHHPYEKDGVDFWWIDWQQGKNTKLKDLDPLWALNHYHYLDSQKDNRRGMILSRYAEIGSHRYPLGFSGDTMISWPCYRFQPYFTATATNAGYTWWSHDIGGHHLAKKDDELYLRWLQFGVFSPINRLHSTSNEFMGKEPWKYRWDVEQLATRYLRLRHRMIPYLYTMNHRTHQEGIALTEPMYYAHPNRQEAYACKNEYQFGSELIVAPVTEPLHPKTNLAGAEVWLPEGRYTDVFTGQIYEGGRRYKMFRGLETLPVLAKAGAIIPLDQNDRVNDWHNPAAMELLLYRGSNSFTLYEDDGETRGFEKGAFATRTFTLEEWGDTLTFTLAPYRGDLSVVQPRVSYKLSFRDLIAAGQVTVTKNGAPAEFRQLSGDTLTFCLPDVLPTDQVTVQLQKAVALCNRNRKEALIELISKYQLDVTYKAKTFDAFVQEQKPLPQFLPDYLKEPIQEILALKDF